MEIVEKKMDVVQPNIVQRIMNKVVGQQISAEELELISGGTISKCGDAWTEGEFSYARCER